MKIRPSSLIAAAAAIALLAGCETESASSASISVSPSSASVSQASPSVTLSASGGWNYTWSLSDSSIGTLDRSTGSSVTYTGTAFGSTNGAVQTVSVTSSALTNSVAGSASASITHR